MATTNTVKRVTKSQRFSDIKALLNGEEVTYGTTVEAAVEFIDNEIGLLVKKNSGEKKPTKTQLENETYKAQILEFLGGQTEGKTCTEIMKAIPEFAEFSNQKVASLVRQLCDAKQVTKEVVKGKALFTIVRE